MHIVSTRERIWIEQAGAPIAVARWGNAKSGMPPVLLMHGTGFVAEVWEDVARTLALNHVVYAFDRRGHGASHKPEAHQYHFLDFALDACAVIETLQLSGLFGIGHSAGGTDLLLAAKLLPDHFSRLFVIEPTVMNPAAGTSDGGKLSDGSMEFIQQIRRRRAEFPSGTAAFQRLRTSPTFANWSEPALWTYLPAFHKEMVARAFALIPTTSRWNFDGVGHCIPQEAPELLIEALQQFAGSAA